MRSRWIMILVLVLAAGAVSAQLRIPCTRPDTGTTRGTRAVLPPVRKDWDPQKTYRQPVVLITFKDCEFSMDDPVAYYNRIFNEPGYNEGVGKGCVADYFREQSGGRFNVQFDIYGPIQADTTVANKTGSSNDGSYAIHNVMKSLCRTSDADFSIYDWDGDDLVDQVLFIAAGYNGVYNKGYIWPATGYKTFRAPGGKYVTMSSISTELWDKVHGFSGIGTIIHEFVHCLGLPDLYPTLRSVGYSVVDDWDLMDGGNYINWGWCPPNLSAMEKMCLGWGNPVELTEPTSIRGMKPVSDGGVTYLVRNSYVADEYYLLENRAQTGWDYGVPGNGLLIIHVDFDPIAWENNVVNIDEDHFRYDIFHPDGKSYNDFDPAGGGKDLSRFTMEGRLRSSYLSTTTYPYTDSLSLVRKDCLTDDSDPAATLFNANADWKYLMSKPITNIQLAPDGTISFDFMKTSTGIGAVVEIQENDDLWYDLQGRRLMSEPLRKGLYIHKGKLVSKY